MEHFTNFLHSSLQNQTPVVYPKLILQTSFRNTNVTQTEHYTTLLESTVSSAYFLGMQRKKSVQINFKNNLSCDKTFCSYQENPNCAILCLRTEY